MTSVYIIRHGQTAWNKQLMFRGRVDVQLNEHGVKEAWAVTGALKDKNIKFVYSSPLGRALMTALPVAEEFGLEIAQCDALIDMNFGEWEGKALDDVKRDDPDRFRTWVENPHELRIPGGETLAEVQERSMAMLRKIVEDHPAGAGVIVSHRVVCKLLTLGLMGLGPDRFWNVQQDTACINLFKIEGDRAIMFQVNGTGHLNSIKGRVTADF